MLSAGRGGVVLLAVAIAACATAAADEAEHVEDDVPQPSISSPQKGKERGSQGRAETSSGEPASVEEPPTEEASSGGEGEPQVDAGDGDCDTGRHCTNPDPPSVESLDSVESIRAYSFAMRAQDASEERQGELISPCRERPIEDDGSTCRAETTSVELDDQARQSVLEMLKDPGLYGTGDDAAACFDPRHAFGLFDAEGRLLAQVVICIDCNIVRTYPGVDPIASVLDEEQRLNTGGGFVSAPISLDGISRLRKMCEEFGIDRCNRLSWLEQQQGLTAPPEDE